MTARRFFALPDPTGGFVWELHLGELVKRKLPTRSEYSLKMRIGDLLIRTLGRRRWLVGIARPYGLTRGNDFRAADVGAVLHNNWNASPDSDVMIGSPDIVVQVGREQDAVLHITLGASAVWLVRPERREIVAVTSPSRNVYGIRQTIHLPGSASINVSEIFS